MTDDLERAIELTRKAAAAYGRPDLVEQVDLLRARVDTVALFAVVGEFQSGKSSLVDAITVEAACPADAEWTTTIPTVVSLGGPRGATGITSDDTSPTPLAIDDLATVVTDRSQAWDRFERVEVRLGLLDDGDDDPFALVDTPGAGGWYGRLGTKALGWLPLAMGAIVVHDGASPVTASEMELIELADRLCPSVSVAVTRIDLHPAWREVVADTRARLDGRGLTRVPVLPASARLASSPDDDDVARSGVDELLDWIVTIASEASPAGRLRTACLSVVAALEHDLGAERAALAAPARQPVSEPDRPRLPWPTVLADGITDLGTDVDARWKVAGRDLVRACDEHLDTIDPAQDWPAFEIWLRQESARRATEVFGALQTGLSDLSTAVADALHADASDLPAEPGGEELYDLLAGIDLDLRLQATAGLGSRSFSALRASYSGMTLAGMMAGIAGLSLAGPALVVFGAAMAGKTVRDERKKQLEQRRQQAKSAARRYLDDLSALVHQTLRDGLRVGQRTLRDRGSVLADGIEERKRRRNPAELGDAERGRRIADLDAELERLAKLRARLERLPLDAEPAAAP